MIDQLQQAGRLNERLASPVVRHQSVTNVRVERRARARPMVVVIRSLMGIRTVKLRQKPVPVQQRDVGIQFGCGMPPQQMIVMSTDLARTVVMANVVIVRLRQGHVNHAQNHDPD